MTIFGGHNGIPLDERLRRFAVLWRARHGVNPRRFGTESLNDSGFMETQARGRSIKFKTTNRVLTFMGRPPLGPLLRSEVEVGPHYDKG